MTAELLPTPRFVDYGHGPMLVKERASLGCGCGCLVGLLLARQPPEPFASAYACSPDHETLAAHFALLLRESTVEPQARPLIEVVDELLGEAERHHGGGRR